LDIAQGAVVSTFSRGVEIHAGVPATGQFFDRGNIDGAIVKEVVEEGHVSGDETAIDTDRIAGQR